MNQNYTYTCLVIGCVSALQGRTVTLTLRTTFPLAFYGIFRSTRCSCLLDSSSPSPSLVPRFWFIGELWLRYSFSSRVGFCIYSFVALTSSVRRPSSRDTLTQPLLVQSLIRHFLSYLAWRWMGKPLIVHSAGL
jgi:hypothetical protein